MATQSENNSAAPENTPGDNINQYRFTYFEFLTNKSNWDITDVQKICQNLVTSRQVFFSRVDILESGLHRQEFTNLDHIATKITYLEKPEQAKVWSAIAFALRSHALQKRQTGEPFSVHILEVVSILADMHLDAATLVTGALHDTVEDCVLAKHRPAFLKLLTQCFGPAPVASVNYITKLQDIRKLHIEVGDEMEWINQLYQNLNMVPKQSSLPKTLVDELYRLTLVTTFISKNQLDIVPTNVNDLDLTVIRAIIVKLVDRLHNMRTLSAMSNESQQKNSLETLEVYVKLAQKFGVWDIARELEAISSEYLYPGKRENLNKIIDVIDQIDLKKLNLADLTTAIIPGKLQNLNLTNQFSLPGPAAMQTIGEPYLTLDIAVPEIIEAENLTPKAALTLVAQEIITKLKNHFGNQKKIIFPDVAIMIDLIMNRTLNIFSFFIPMPIDLHPDLKQLRINILSATVLKRENSSLLPLISPAATKEEIILAFNKWAAIQSHAEEYQKKFGNLFKTFTSAELLLVLTQKVPAGKILVIGSPPITKNGYKRPSLPWLMPQKSTIGDFIKSIESLKKKEISEISINGMVATDLNLPLLPFDEITISTAKPIEAKKTSLVQS